MAVQKEIQQLSTETRIKAMKKRGKRKRIKASCPKAAVFLK